MWPDRLSNPGPLTYESGAYRLRYAVRLSWMKWSRSVEAAQEAVGMNGAGKSWRGNGDCYMQLLQAH